MEREAGARRTDYTDSQGCLLRDTWPRAILSLLQDIQPLLASRGAGGGGGELLADPHRHISNGAFE